MKWGCRTAGESWESIEFFPSFNTNQPLPQLSNALEFAFSPALKHPHRRITECQNYEKNG